MTALDVSFVFDRRLLDLLDQAARSDPPGGWGTVRPQDKNLRTAAGVLLRVAALDDRSAMIAKLARLERTERDRRPDRSGGEGRLWRELQGLIQGLETVEEGQEPVLRSLALWRTGGEGGEGLADGVQAILSDLRRSLPAELPIHEEFLTRAAKVLLRGRAAVWHEEARRQERVQEDASAVQTEGGGAA